jgi:hypothetical protein
MPLADLLREHQSPRVVDSHDRTHTAMLRCHFPYVNAMPRHRGDTAMSPGLQVALAAAQKQSAAMRAYQCCPFEALEWTVWQTATG